MARGFGAWNNSRPISFVPPKGVLRDSNIITGNVVLLPPNSLALVGREASMAYMKAYPPITKFTATKDEVVGRGDLEAVFTTELALVTTATGTGSREEV